MKAAKEVPHAGLHKRPDRPSTAVDDSAVEDQAHLVGAADVEVVADDLLEEDPPRHRLVEHLGQGELGLQDRDVVAVAGGAVGGGERVRQDRQPLAQQRVDLRRSQAVADRLQRGRVVDRGEPVVQRLERNAGLGGLALRPVVAVDAQLGVVRKVGAELQEERAEIVVVAVEVEVVDQPGGLDDPRIRITVGVATFLGRNTAVFSCARPTNSTPSAPGNSARCSWATSSLRRPL